MEVNNIQTKFNVGDVLWADYDGRNASGTVEAISLTIYEDYYEIWYDLVDCVCKDRTISSFITRGEEYLFKTEDELNTTFNRHEN